jgi:hypothetical protein
MRLSTLIKHLLRSWFKYGNVEVDILTEDSTCQVEQPLGDIAYSSREKRVKLLPEGF